MFGFTTEDIIKNLIFSVQWTVYLSLMAFIGGCLVGLLILILRIYNHHRFVNHLIYGYIQLFQGTPLLMQLFLAYFGIALLGIDTNPIFAAAFCLTVYTSAYLTDIWYGSVKSIHQGQWEASLCLALTRYQQLRYVIFPQALRISIAPTLGFIVQVIKGTALASVIGFVELTRTGQMLANATYQPFLVYGLVAALYFVLCFPLSLWSRSLEKKLKQEQ